MTEAAEVVKDDKRIITDVAFGVNPVLLGRKLATPFQRGMAMLVDAFLVLLLTDVSGVFWGILAGIAFFHAGKKQQNKRWRLTRYLLRMFGALVIFISVVVMYGDMTTATDKSDESVKIPVVNSDGVVLKDTTSVSQLIGIGSLVTEVIQLKSDFSEQGACPRSCYHPRIQKLVKAMAASGLDETEVMAMVEEVLPDTAFANEQSKQNYLAEIQTVYLNLATTTTSMNETSTDAKLSKGNTQGANHSSEPDESGKGQAEQEDKAIYSMLEYVKALIADLGLGFGWAALYFTAFSAWWHGQTLGKKLMKIRVIQLDGSYMSAWDSFGRYGGYGAGFATGLMGFLQIFWDSNRQAIQDKISATVVIQGDIK